MFHAQLIITLIRWHIVHNFMCFCSSEWTAAYSSFWRLLLSTNKKRNFLISPPLFHLDFYSIPSLWKEHKYLKGLFQLWTIFCLKPFHHILYLGFICHSSSLCSFYMSFFFFCFFFFFSFSDSLFTGTSCNIAATGMPKSCSVKLYI